MKLVSMRPIEGGGIAMSFEPRDEDERKRVRTVFDRLKKQADESEFVFYTDTDELLKDDK